MSNPWVDKEIGPVTNTTGDPVVHPEYYGGKDDVYEAIKVINAWELGFNLGNVVKYISRCGKKENNSMLQDLKKARFYLDNKIESLEAKHK